MTSLKRRYDVDWLRTLVLGLLIIYHIVITFQPWAWYIGFIVNDKPIESLWTVMSLINIWRIPILFLISGMGVRFAMERRNTWQLLQDRTVRILLPLVFGYFFITPIGVVAVTKFYSIDTTYEPGAGHLWFLANIFSYVILLLPALVYLKNHPDNIVLRSLRWIFERPLGILIVVLPVVMEAAIINPADFVTYAETWHGFWIGLVCFLTGFIFITLDDVFWDALRRVWWIVLPLAFGLYLLRDDTTSNVVIGLESMLWMLAILGLGSLHLNRPSGVLRYLSQAVYPVYIVHLPVQFILSYYIIPMDLSPWSKFFLLIVSTFGVCFLLYEIIRRIRWIRPLFGMKLGME